MKPPAFRFPVSSRQTLRFSTTKVVDALRSRLSSKSCEISSSVKEIRSGVCILNLISLTSGDSFRRSMKLFLLVFLLLYTEGVQEH